MMKRINVLCAAAVLVVLAFASLTDAQTKSAGGGGVRDFKLADTDGVTRSISDLRGKNGTVLIFLSIQCPVVKGYNERINRLAADYEAKGVKVIGINSNATEAAAQIKTHREANYKFPVLLDAGSVIADELGANVTPEVYYLNANNVLLYHGAIDNSRNGENITENTLRDAIDDTLAGKPLTKTSKNAFGCSIKRAAKE